MFRINLIQNAVALALLMVCQCVHGQTRTPHFVPDPGYAPDGVLEPWRISEVACIESGLVKRLHITSGARVLVGDTLAELDTASLEIQIAVAEAQAAAVGRQEMAEAELSLQERKVSAIRDARENEYSSQLELERAEADLLIAQARLTAELEERRILQLQVERLKQQLSQRVIHAPFDGIVAKIHKEVGEFVAPNTPELVRLIDATRLRTSFFLQADEVQTLPKNNQLRVRLNDGSIVDAELEQISPIADSESGLIEVRVLIENQELKIHGSRCSLILHASQI